ncbi:MAG TPA: hypothetical protein VMY16_12200 [Ilumatobacteraceae bacterium]|nr:hypothetical protein [Ilumatobacteraceae bacterium]
MQRRTARIAASAVAIALASAVLAGCFTVEATFSINDDATADVDYLVLIDTEQLQELSGLLGEDTGALGDLSGDALLGEFLGGDDPCGDLTQELSTYEVSTREIDEGGEVGVGCTVSGVPIAELNSLGDDTSSFMIEQDDDGTRFDAVLEGVDELAGDPSETDMITEMLGVSLDDLFTIRFVVSAPGSLGDNNASSTGGATATWDVKPDADFVTDGDATMTAEWTPGGGSSSSVWIILAIIATVAAIAAVAIVLVKRSKGQHTEVADAAAGVPTSPPGTTPPSPITAPPPPPPGMAQPPGPGGPAPVAPPPPPAASEPPTAPPPPATPPPPPPPPS